MLGVDGLRVLHVYSELTLNLTYFPWKMKCVSFIATAPMARTVKTENSTVSPTLMDLLDENYNKKHPAGSQDLENLWSSFCPYFLFLTEDPVERSESCHYSVHIVPLS